jgi:hypothetical protein
MRDVIAVAVLCMGLVSFMGLIINFNSAPRPVSCTIDVKHTDHVATYVGTGAVYDY